MDDYTIFETTPPTVSRSVRADADPTSASSVDFSVTFSEPVTGVDTTDFSLTTTGGVTGASITGVTGADTTYTVTADTGTGDGTIRLDVLDDDTIQDAASLPLDGGFTSGEVYMIVKTGVGTYDDRYVEISYSGSWLQSSYSGPYAGTITYSNVIGSTASFTFDGEGITLKYTGYTTRGTMDIYIDAGYVTTLDQYSSSLQWQQEWSSGALGAGVHTISFEHMSGSTAGIDALIVTGPPPPPTCWVLTLTHTGSGSDPAASPTNSTGCSAGEYHVGETISLSGAVPTSGWVISSWTGTDDDASIATTNVVTMPDSAHGAAVNYVEPSGTGTYDDRDAGIIYSGDWSQANYNGPYMGTITQSNTIGSTASFTFDGDSITLKYTGYTTRGTVDIYIDGGYVTTLDQYSSSLLWQQEWSSGSLGSGIHTISFEHVGGANVGIDALIVVVP